MAAITAFLISIIMGADSHKWLYRLKIGEEVRKARIPKAISGFLKSKEGTLTMGGLLIILAIVVSTLLWADMLNKIRDPRRSSRPCGLAR